MVHTSLVQEVLLAQSRASYSTLAAEHEHGADLSSPDQHTAVIVHGLLGSARNWRTLRKKLQDHASSQTGRC